MPKKISIGKGTTHLDTRKDGCFPVFLAIVVIGFIVIVFII